MSSMSFRKMIGRAIALVTGSIEQKVDQAIRSVVEPLEERKLLTSLFWSPLAGGLGGNGTWDLTTSNWVDDMNNRVTWNTNALAVFKGSPSQVLVDHSVHAHGGISIQTTLNLQEISPSDPIDISGNISQSGSGIATIGILPANEITLSTGTVEFTRDIGTSLQLLSNTHALFDTTQHLEYLDLYDGASIKMTAAGTHVLSVTNLNVFSNTAQIDITNNAMVVHTGDKSSLIARVQQGQNGFDANGMTIWNGSGIVSSTARTSNLALGLDVYWVGVLQNSDIATATGTPGADLYDTFFSEPLESSSILIRATLGGDTDLNGTITIDDYNNIDATASGLLENVGWLTGDSDFSGGSLTIDDFNFIDTSFLYQNTQASELHVGTTTTFPQPDAPISVWLQLENGALIDATNQYHWRVASLGSPAFASGIGNSFTFTPSSADFVTSAGMIVQAFDSSGNLIAYRVLSDLLPALPSGGYEVPTGNPNAPQDSDPFEPPVSDDIALIPPPGNLSPAFAEWTRSAGPDDTLAISATNIANDDAQLEFIAFGQTRWTDRVLEDALLQHVDTGTASVTLSESMPKGSMYFVWAHNSNGGWSYPVAVNKAETWWMTGHAKKGESVSVYGQNLSYHGGIEKSWAYISKIGSGVGEWVSVTSANPYKIDFTIPSDLSNTGGDYNVWVHNGSGGKYGWSLPQKVTVDAQPVSEPNPPATIDVTEGLGKWGVINETDSVDDTDALVALLTNSGGTYWAPGDTLFFPQGTYLINRALPNVSNVTLAGDLAGLDSSGMSNSRIVTSDDFVATQEGGSYMFVQNGTFSNTTFRNLELSCADSPIQMGAAIKSAFSNVTLDHVFVDAGNYHTLAIGTGTRVHFTGCKFRGRMVYLGSSDEVTIVNSEFRQRCGYSSDAITGAITHLSVVGNVFLNDSEAEGVFGWGSGRIFAGGGSAQYFALNESINFGEHPGTNDGGQGEQMLFEGNTSVFMGTPTVSGSNLISFSSNANPGGLGGLVAVIVKGKGLGQLRNVSNYDAVGHTFTLESPWKIVPDASSVVSILRLSAQHVTIYDNVFQGMSDYATRGTSSMLVTFNGSAADSIVAENHASRLHFGAKIIAHPGLTNSVITSVTNGLVFSDNEFSDCMDGLIFQMGGNWDMQQINGMCAMFANVVRRNSFINIARRGILVPGNNLAMNDSSRDLIIEHNQIAMGAQPVTTPWDWDTPPLPKGNAIVGSGANPDQTTLIYKNEFDRGNAPATSYGMYIASAGSKHLLQQNTWIGYSTIFSYSEPAAAEGILEIPIRSIVKYLASGGTSTFTLPIWNSGTSNMSWTLGIGTGATWLSSSKSDGQSHSGLEVDLAIDTTGLAEGPHTAVLTFLSNGQQYLVSITVYIFATLS